MYTAPYLSSFAVCSHDSLDVLQSEAPKRLVCPSGVSGNDGPTWTNLLMKYMKYTIISILIMLYIHVYIRILYALHTIIVYKYDMSFWDVSKWHCKYQYDVKPSIITVSTWMMPGEPGSSCASCTWGRVHDVFAGYSRGVILWHGIGLAVPKCTSTYWK